MGVLGRGLAALIPKRDREKAEDALEQIDRMEFEGNKGVNAAQDAAPYRKLNVMEDFEDLDTVEGMPMPDKPLVTPLPFDPYENEGGAAAVLEQMASQKLKVIEETDEMVSVLPEDIKEEVVTPAPESVAEPEEEEKTAGKPEEIVEPVAEEPAKKEATEEKVKEEEPERPLAKKKGKAKKLSEKSEAAEDFAPAFGEGGAGMWDRHEQQVVHIPIGDIKINPLQPRRSFNPEELDDLTRSIEQHGILQPLVVRRMAGTDGFELIAGERRLRAAKKLGWDKVPCVVRRDVKSDQSRLVFALIENLQRENLNPVEEAIAYQQLNQEYGLTHEEIGERVGKSRVAVTNIVRMLQLPAEIQRGLTEGKITTGHAKAILMIPNEDKQIKFYRHLVDEGLTVRKAEVRARRIQKSMNLQDPLRNRTSGRHPLALKYSPALEQRYGYDAQVKFLQDLNRFEVIFKAHSESEVEDLVGRLMGSKPLATDVDKDVMDE